MLHSCIRLLEPQQNGGNSKSDACWQPPQGSLEMPYLRVGMASAYCKTCPSYGGMSQMQLMALRSSRRSLLLLQLGLPSWLSGTTSAFLHRGFIQRTLPLAAASWCTGFADDAQESSHTAGEQQQPCAEEQAQDVQFLLASKCVSAIPWRLGSNDTEPSWRLSLIWTKRLCTFQSNSSQQPRGLVEESMSWQLDAGCTRVYCVFTCICQGGLATLNDSFFQQQPRTPIHVLM